ncbi:hypothetical protein SRB5_58230 [Streptomyces sp. RB5]|uniref:Uncharacterized protein n=1 Tax=Streptomyces smaragdinus TaxID=2585196 RepID=A0A7K0CQ82_9ACTN|nr:hypothetical protein [Streptomyces smaragdinus]MQY15636.1 hypothetical protein [Streptomyces smaragdinus]
MSALSSAHHLAVTLASAAEGSGGESGGHDSLQPFAVGGGALAALLLLLWITTRFNRD